MEKVYMKAERKMIEEACGWFGSGAIIFSWEVS